LHEDIDAWVATADPSTGKPYLVPLSFLWHDSTVLIATPTDSPTGRNLLATSRVRLGLGPTRDVVVIEGIVTGFAAPEISVDVGDAFAAKAGFDPRELSAPYTYFRVTPRRIQAWREVDELAGRDLMRAGTWLVH
jgi:hypothetical protein